MNPLILAPVLEIGKSLLDRWFPDPAEKAKAEAAMLQMLQEQELRKVLAQLEVNAKEAASPHMFVAGWRPAVGWCCAAGFLWATIGQPVLGWLALKHGWPEPPAIDTDVLMYVLGGLLGLGGFRSLEKIKGAAK
jgi:hypothetical protein